MTWTQTYTGQAFDLVNPVPATIRLDDIAIPLSRIVRFNGHTKDRYTVADHLLLCERLCLRHFPPAIRLAILIHDAHEAYLGDITSPVASLLRSDALKDSKRAIDAAICKGIGLPWDFLQGYVAHDIKRIDRQALAIEKRDMLGPEPQPWTAFELPTPRTDQRAAADPEAGKMWVWRLRALVSEAGLTPTMPDFWDGAR